MEPEDVIFRLRHPDVYGDSSEDAIEVIEALVATLESWRPHMPFAGIEPWDHSS